MLAPQRHVLTYTCTCFLRVSFNPHNVVAFFCVILFFLRCNIFFFDYNNLLFSNVAVFIAAKFIGNNMCMCMYVCMYLFEFVTCVARVFVLIAQVLFPFLLYAHAQCAYRCVCSVARRPWRDFCCLPLATCHSPIKRATALHLLAQHTATY